MRHAAKRRTYNLTTKAKVKTAIKDTRKVIAAKDAKASVEALKNAMSQLDKAAKKGVIHKNTASRKKSRLAKAIAKI